MRADEAARWCGRGDCGHTGLIEVIAVDGSGLLRLVKALGIQFCLNGFTDLLVLTDPLDAEPTARFRAVFQLPHTLFKAFGFECTFEAAAVQCITLAVRGGPLVVLLAKLSDGVIAVRADHALLCKECAGWVHFLPRPRIRGLDFGRNNKAGLIPLDCTLYGPSQDRGLRFRCREQRLQIRVDLCRNVFERDADYPPPDRWVVRGHKWQIVDRKNEF